MGMTTKHCACTLSTLRISGRTRDFATTVNHCAVRFTVKPFNFAATNFHELRIEYIFTATKFRPSSRRKLRAWWGISSLESLLPLIPWQVLCTGFNHQFSPNSAISTEYGSRSLYLGFLFFFFPPSVIGNVKQSTQKNARTSGRLESKQLPEQRACQDLKDGCHALLPTLDYLLGGSSLPHQAPRICHRAKGVSPESIREILFQHKNVLKSAPEKSAACERS